MATVISTTMTTDESHEVLLRPVIARLRELEKKCVSMGSRNEEFPLMQMRLASIIKRLETGREPSGAPLPYRAIAREIFPVAHLFESVGFMSVGKEVAHIEKILRDLEPETPDQTSEPAVNAQVKAVSTTARISSASPEPLSDPNAALDEGDGPASGSGLPWPVLIAFLVLLIAAGISASLIFDFGPFRETPPTLIPSPTPAPVTATPSPHPTAVSVAPSRTRIPTAKLADELSQARLAIAREDLAGAVSHLSAAAMIDRDNTTVLEIAEQLVHRLVEEADAVTEWGRWTEAEQHLERARRIAMRFGIETTLIDSTARRHAAMERFSIVGPDETAAILAAVGKRVVVTLADRNRRSGRIQGLAGAVLLLEVDSDVGGGVVRYNDEIPLDTITSIRIYED
jgi:hypothetical protein